jgi:hypothetical protein
MFSRTLLVLLPFLISACATSEEQKVDSGPVAANNLITPPLSEVFPLDPKPDGMRVQFPVLLDDQTILGPIAVLRFVYNKPIEGEQPYGPLKTTHSGESTGDQGEASSTQGRHHRGGVANQGGSGNGSAESSGPEQSTAISGSTNTLGQLPAKGAGTGGSYGGLEENNVVWVDKFLYVEALDNAVEKSTTVIYSLPPDSKPLAATINFPGGMLLGEFNSHVQVLGLSETSSAYLAGVRPGDEVKSISNSSPLSVTTLPDFVRIYATAKQHAEATGQASVSIDFWNPKDSKIITTEINFLLPSDPLKQR